MQLAFRIVRYLVRAAVAAMAVFLLYAHVKRPDAIALAGVALLYGVLGLILLATFVTTSASSQPGVGKDGIPAYLTPVRIFFGLSFGLLFVAFAGLMTGQTYVAGRFETRLVDRYANPHDYWVSICIHLAMGLGALVFAFVVRAKSKRLSDKPDRL